MTPDYQTNAPAGWLGNPKRGAAMGRPSIAPDPRTPDELETDAAQFEALALSCERDKEGRHVGDSFKPRYWVEAAADFRGRAAELRAMIPAAGVRLAATPKVTLQRVRLDAGGYDQAGCYWGHGAPLYWAATDDGALDTTLRANSRDEAKERVRAIMPGARFAR